MSLKSDLAAYLVADTTLAGQVGTDTGSAVQVYSVYVPQYASPPYLVLQRTSAPRFHHSQGASDVYETRVDVNAYGTTPDEADDIIDSLIRILDGFQGMMGTTTVRGAFVETVADLPEYLQGGEEFGWFRSLAELLIWHL